MTHLLALSVFGVEWKFLKPFIVIGLAFGGVDALSGFGRAVLYRATGWRRQPPVRDGVGPRLRTARPARQDDGHARPRADPARSDGVAGSDRRSVRALSAAAQLDPLLHHLGNEGQPHADHRHRPGI